MATETQSDGGFRPQFDKNDRRSRWKPNGIAFECTANGTVWVELFQFNWCFGDLRCTYWLVCDENQYLEQPLVSVWRSVIHFQRPKTLIECFNAVLVVLAQQSQHSRRNEFSFNVKWIKVNWIEIPWTEQGAKIENGSKDVLTIRPARNWIDVDTFLRDNDGRHTGKTWRRSKHTHAHVTHWPSPWLDAKGNLRTR